MNEQWRISIGLFILLVSVGWPLLIPVLVLLGVSGASVAAFAGAMMIVAELLLLAAVAIAGKAGFAFIKARASRLLRSLAPPAQVSRTRYRAGLVLFAIPLLFGWAVPYIGPSLPTLMEDSLRYAIAGDVLLLLSLVILGGDFWEKLRSLFLHRARALIPGSKDTC